MEANQYLPESFREIELYKGACELIDYALTIGTQDIDHLILEPLATQLITRYGDKEALASYYNLFIEPIIGTSSSLSFLIDLLKYDAQFLEWFNRDQIGWPLPPYKLILDFGDNYPFNNDPNNPHINWDLLIDLFELLKNERTRIISFRMDDCGNPLCLDYGVLDKDFLDSMSGYLYRNIRICMYQKHNQLLTDVDFLSDTKESLMGIKGTVYTHSFIDRLDYFVFGQKTNNQINVGDFKTTYFGTKYDYSPVVFPTPFSSYYTQNVIDDNWNPSIKEFQTTMISESLPYEIIVNHSGHQSLEYSMWVDVSDQWSESDSINWIGRD